MITTKTMRRSVSALAVAAALIGVVVWAAGSSVASAQGAGSAVTRGKFLVESTGCHDCHTPLKMGPNGPEPDMTRALSGHPAEMKMPPPPAPSGPWIGSMAATMTAWAGPWGVSYTANLTPHKDNGLGSWTEQQFIDMMRTGRHQGRGREILPPMPWTAYKNMTDADLKAMFAYLRSLPPNANKVPDPVIAPVK
jgi:mono/diheme cytochrome c family protein